MWLVVVPWWFWYDCFNISSGFGFGLFCLRGGIWFSDFAGPGLWFVSLWFVLMLWFCGDTLVVGLQVRGFWLLWVVVWGLVILRFGWWFRACLWCYRLWFLCGGFCLRGCLELVAGFTVGCVLRLLGLVCLFDLMFDLAVCDCRFCCWVVCYVVCLLACLFLFDCYVFVCWDWPLFGFPAFGLGCSFG